MAFTILQSDFVVYGLLPFVLVFVVVFAILQKTKILGDGKKQIDALVALAIALIVVAFGYAVDIIVPLAAFLAVSAIVILVFMILFGMVHKSGELDIGDKLRVVFGIIAAVGVVIAVLIFSGGWNYFYDFLVAKADSALLGNVAFIVIILAVAAFVLFYKEKPNTSG